jgi:hypothetical protein
MKKIFLTLLAVMLNFAVPLVYSQEPEGINDEEDFITDEDLTDEQESKRLEEERKKREEEEKKKQEEARKLEEQKRALESKREAIRKKNLKLRQKEEEEKAKLNALKDAGPNTTEYTLDPSSVKLVVELDPKSYGFRTRDYNMVFSLNVDPFFRGRGFLQYDFRFFNYLSLGLMGGIDYSNMSLYSRFREDLSKRNPSQFAILGGANAKWRLTEWYMKSAFFLEPSILFGRMWQTLLGTETAYWRLSPGIFLGMDSVFDSGFSLATRFGLEFPINFGTPNPIKVPVEPLFVLGFGFAI